MEQLLVDNENLLDQIALLQQNQQEDLQIVVGRDSTAHLGVDQIPNTYQLYNQGSSTIKNGRNNDKTDQTHSSFELHGNLKVVQHTNSSNKDLSPQTKIQKDNNAFMRAILRDETSQYMTPYTNQPQNNSSSTLHDDTVMQLQQPQAKMAQDPFFQSFSNELREAAILSQRLQLGQSGQFDVLSQKLEELCGTFELKTEKIRHQCAQDDQVRDLLATKVQGVDRLELETLELHMQLDAKLRALETLLKCSQDASKLFQFDHKKQAETSVQTDMRFCDVEQKEATLQVFSKELSLVKMRQTEDVEARRRDLEKRECDIEIRERLIEEKRVEYSYKQKELNQRIKSQMTWPLNCLENDTKLLEKFKDFKILPDHIKNIEADSNLSLFMQREENLKMLQHFEGEMQAKCEGLLHFEYLLLKERAKNIVFHENTLSELTNLQSESEELAKDRERYQVSSDFERQLQEESQRIDQARNELLQIQENLMKLVTVLSDTLCQLGKTYQLPESATSISTSPDIKPNLPSNQLNLLLSNLKKNFSSNSEDSMGKRVCPAINPYSQTISAKDPATLLQVVNDYRSTDPMSNYMRSKDLPQLIETAIEHLESSSRLKANSPKQEGQDRQNLRQIRRMLVRDAYFLQKERQWLDQERLKLNSHLARTNNRRKLNASKSRTAQVQTSLDRHDFAQMTRSASNSKNQFNIEMIQRQKTSQWQVDQPSMPPRIQNQQSRQSIDSAVNLGTIGQNNASEASQVDNISVVSTLEQDRKKIQLLQMNLSLEKDYNQELSMQLSAQMELIKVQNQKLLAGESHINEMKLRLLVKYEQIKLLEDFYNQHHYDEEDLQIHLDIELDESQLKDIVLQLHHKYSQGSDYNQQSHLEHQNQPHSMKEELEDDLNCSASADYSEQRVQKMFDQSLPKKREYEEFWAQTGVAAILRHLLMEKCRFNPGMHRLQYAFMLLRCATLRPTYNYMNGSTQQLKELLQSTPNESRFDEIQPRAQQNDTITIQEQQKQLSKQVSVSGFIALEHSQQPVSASKNQFVMVAAQQDQIVIDDELDWFKVYWQKKRDDYFKSDDKIISQRDIATNLESDVASFWKFRARVTLRLMQLHAGRRGRLLQYFAFQRYKVQSMRATVQKVISARLQDRESVDILNSTPLSKQELIEKHSVNSVQLQKQRSHASSNEMTVSKRHAVLMLLTHRNSKLRQLRMKNSALAKWKDTVRDSQRFTVQLEVARLGQEVHQIRMQEEMMRTSFLAQKNELESKVTILLGMIAS